MNAIARKTPSRTQLTKSVSINAELYGLSIEEYRQACQDWLESEGYDGLGNEYEDVYEWLTIPHEQNITRDPFDGGRSAGAMGKPTE